MSEQKEQENEIKQEPKENNYVTKEELLKILNDNNLELVSNYFTRSEPEPEPEPEPEKKSSNKW